MQNLIDGSFRYMKLSWSMKNWLLSAAFKWSLRTVVSLLTHIWSSTPRKVIKTSSLVRYQSDYAGFGGRISSNLPAKLPLNGIDDLLSAYTHTLGLLLSGGFFRGGKGGQASLTILSEYWQNNSSIHSGFRELYENVQAHKQEKFSYLYVSNRKCYR